MRIWFCFYSAGSEASACFAREDLKSFSHIFERFLS